jgi:hypothetical protein
MLCRGPAEIVDVRGGDVVDEAWIDHGRHGTLEAVRR